MQGQDKAFIFSRQAYFMHADVATLNEKGRVLVNSPLAFCKINVRLGVIFFRRRRLLNQRFFLFFHRL